MTLKLCLGIFLLLPAIQKAEVAFLLRGDLVAKVFADYHDKLNTFYKDLHVTIQTEAPDLEDKLESEPPRPAVFGYQLVPKLIDEPPDNDPRQFEARQYSWPLTEGYIQNEVVKLGLIQNAFSFAKRADVEERHELLRQAVGNYRELVHDQKTLDQIIEYNRFWQRIIAADRPRYDQLTEIYRQLQEKDPDVSNVIRTVLGKPDVPAFVRVVRKRSEIILHVPLYTDIEDDSFLSAAKSIIESAWKIHDSGSHVGVEVEWRRIAPTKLYEGAKVPAIGSHLDLRAHAQRFPTDGGVLTTGAEATYAVVGRFIALGNNDTPYSTIAHEFGHILGFRDGYVRAYRDLGTDGFEILEMTPSFDDLMSAPRSGRVQPTHFRLLLDALSR
jgi:hypothetical protein